MSIEDRLLTAGQVAQRLGVKLSTIRAWTFRGRIPHLKLGSRAVRYRVSDMDRIVKRGLEK